MRSRPDLVVTEAQPRELAREVPGRRRRSGVCVAVPNHAGVRRAGCVKFESRLDHLLYLIQSESTPGGPAPTHRTHVAAEAGVSEMTVRKWRGRIVEHGLAGLAGLRRLRHPEGPAGPAIARRPA